jgi:putative membrane protein
MVGQGRPGFPALQRHRTREDSSLIVSNAGLAVGLEATAVNLAAALGIFGAVSRRTTLANERTFLAWIRSGLSALAVSLAVGRLLPALLDRPRGAFAILGVGYALFGSFLLAYGAVRHHSVQKALERDEFTMMPTAVAVGLAIYGLLLGAGSIALLLA